MFVSSRCTQILTVTVEEAAVSHYEKTNVGDQSMALGMMHLLLLVVMSGLS